MNIQECKHILPQVLEVGLVPFLQGAPGIGKTDIVKEVAKEMIRKDELNKDGKPKKGWPLYYLSLAQLSRESFLMAVPDIKEKKLEFFLLGIPAERNKDWIFFLDEVDKSDLELQGLLLALLREKKLGSLDLGKVHFILAGNSPENSSDSQPFIAPLQSRIVQINVEPVQPADWLQWASQKYTIPSWLYGFLSQIPSQLWYTPTPPEDFEPYPSPRGWEDALKYITKHNPQLPLQEDTFLIIKGTVGNLAAKELVKYTELQQNFFSWKQFKEYFSKKKIPQISGTQGWYLIGETIQNFEELTDEMIGFLHDVFVKNTQVALFARWFRMLKDEQKEKVLNVEKVFKTLEELVMG